MIDNGECRTKHCMKTIIGTKQWYFGASLTIQQFDHIFSFTLQGAAPIEVSHGHGSNGVARHASGASPIRPEIPEPLPNVTVAVGREATLPCVVRNLKDYKVIKTVILDC